MRPTINALVLGAGRFGSHYVRILARLNNRQFSDTPAIGKLIVTRTTQSGARRAAREARAGGPTAVEGIIPEKVAHTGDLKRVLNQHRPGLIAIVARDHRTGDAIHGRYTRIALSHGAVLCEKPFLPADGDGTSLNALKAIAAQNFAHPLGLELPMAVVAQHLHRIPTVAAAMQGAKQIRYHWASSVRADVCLIDDLVLHPWSLLPPGFTVTILDQSTGPQQADIRLRLTHRRMGRTLPCQVRLSKGGGLRSMSIDDVTLIFQTRGRWVRVFQVDRPRPEPLRSAAGLNAAREVLAIDNPLEQHIVAMLRQRPIVGFDDICQSQLFLEKLHGYAATESDD